MERSLSRATCIAYALAAFALTSLTGPAAADLPASGPKSVAGVEPTWFRAAAGEAERLEYQVSGLAPQAPNRAHGFRTRFGPRGIEVVPRLGTVAATGWSFGWETSAFGRDGSLRSIGEPARLISADRVVYDYPIGLREWYVNRPDGLEQGFTIPGRPDGDGASVVISGQWADARGTRLRPVPTAADAVELRAADGTTVLRFGGLKVRDAAGHAVACRMTVAGERIELRIDDRDASYPLEVDPVLTDAAWHGESDQAQAYYGYSVATAGDVNGDGYSDVIIGAYLYDAGESNEGAAFLYLGSASGLSTTPAWIGQGNQAVAQYGISVASAGDVNNDSFDDVIVGASGWDNGQTGEGRALVYLGGSGGLTASPAWTMESNIDGAAFGAAVASAGDMNGDGYVDVVIGAPHYTGDQSDEGRIYVFFGGSSGISGASPFRVESDQTGSFYGGSVAGAGDVDGDAYADLIVGAANYDGTSSNQGRAFVYRGSYAGPISTPVWTRTGLSAGDNFGFSVATAGDVNGDGYADILIGIPYTDNDFVGLTNQGQVNLYLGSSAGPESTADWVIVGGQDDACLGCSVATAGDVNGDQFADVIVAAPTYDGSAGTNSGRVWVYEGSATGLPEVAACILDSPQGSAHLGHSVATAGDVDGDGYSDVITGAPFYDNTLNAEGGAWIYRGSSEGLATSAAWYTVGENAEEQRGSSVAGGGDMNGDGYSDVIVGAWQFDGSSPDQGALWEYPGTATGASWDFLWHTIGEQANMAYGLFVANAGDVNGDGYDDLLTSDHRYSVVEEAHEGKVYLYYGSAIGLGSTPGWTMTGEQAGDAFGYSVASAGDVNGDGFADLIVAAPSANRDLDGEGKVYLYLGSASGPGITPAWTMEGNEVRRHFGQSAACAGDVNGDGYSDVIIGAPSRIDAPDPNGRTFVFLGSPAGLGNTSDWSFSPGQAGDSFGSAVSSAGDVNGDGFDDVVIGAPGHNHDGLTESGGGAWVFLGSESGLESWYDYFLYGTQIQSWLGGSVCSAGDVNGDGFSDLCIASVGLDLPSILNCGVVYVKLGSAAGLSGVPEWYEYGTQQNGRFGHDVSCAGDVNGDGFDDLIVGEIAYDEGALSRPGRALIFEGNGCELTGSSRPLVARQVRSATEPLALLGRASHPGSFDLQVVGRTPAGRDRVRLEWTVAPIEMSLNHLASGFGPWYFTAAPVPWHGSTADVLDAIPVSGYDTCDHWRVRVKGKSPLFPHSPWMSMPGTVPSEAQFRTTLDPSSAVSPAVEEARLLLCPAAPNPSAGRTVLAYRIPSASRVQLSIFDASGRRVATVVRENQEAGTHQATWDGRADGRPLPAGTYFARLEAGGTMRSTPIILVR